MENRFCEKMTNEEAAALPVARFEGEIVVVDTADGVEQACRDLLSYPVIGFDSETRPSFKAGTINKVALLQLSTPARCYLFRLNKIALHKPIIQVLESKTTLKIGADVKNDLHALRQLRHFQSEGFVDLQSIVAQWGIAEKSLRKMAGIVLGRRVSKAQRLSNWEASTLTPAQQMYAATDAWICIGIYERLMSTDKKPLPTPEKADGDGGEKSPAKRQKAKKPFFRRFRKPAEKAKEPKPKQTKEQ